jgi:hypothetical protein
VPAGRFVEYDDFLCEYDMLRKIMAVTNISDDNVITTEGGRKQKVEVLEDGTLEVTFQSDGRTESYQSADDSKSTEAIVGCN